MTQSTKSNTIISNIDVGFKYLKLDAIDVNTQSQSGTIPGAGTNRLGAVANVASRIGGLVSASTGTSSSARVDEEYQRVHNAALDVRLP